MTETEKLEQAIQALDAQRSILGDSIVDAALIPLREKLSALKTAAQPAVLESEQQRKIVTVLFADVNEFTAMSEMMDAEDVRDTMNAVWEKLDAVIVYHGGRIDKHMGDGIMALWGVDETREDDPERSIRASLAMQESLEAYAKSAKIELRMRIGLNTGPVILGSIGTRGEHTAMGDTVNAASRLEQAAPPGHILISHDTYRHVRGVFDVEQQAWLDVKGKPELVQAYLVKRIKPRAFRLHTRGIEGVETHMIGRDEEFLALRQIFNRACEDKTADVVTVVGDAGVGKSRLLYEFTAWAELQPSAWWNFKGRASLMTMNAPYALLRDIFAFRFEIQDSDPLNVAREKMVDGILTLMQNDPRALERAHTIGHLIGLDFSASPYLRGILDDPRQLHNRALRDLTEFFSAVTAQGLLIMMIDDLQWADTASLELLSALIKDFPAGHPLLMIGMTRPTLLERFDHWGRDFASHTLITLDALTKDESRILVADILRKVPGLSSALQELIVGGAEGNPFYVEELIKMLIDNKVIIPGVDEWKVSPGQLAVVNVPPTLTEVLQARLDSLPPIERVMLQRGAIVGRIFWDDAIAATGGFERPAIEDALHKLIRKELIFPRKPSAFSNAMEFTFKHTLLHEVTYETLLKRQRAGYHLNVAEWFEKVSGERRAEYLPAIAEHYEKSGDLLRAAWILKEAGERAFHLNALMEASRFLERALAITADLKPISPNVRIELELRLAETCMHLSEYPAARRHAEAAWSAAQVNQLDEFVAEAQNLLGQIALYLGDTASAKSYMLAALYLVRSAAKTDRPGLARVLTSLSSVDWRIGEWESAKQYAQEALEIAEEIGDDNIATMALNRLGVIVGSMGFPAEEEQYYQRSLAIATKTDNVERMATALNNLGALVGWQGQWQRSWDYYMQAMDISHDTGAQQPLALYMINLGLAGSYLGRIDDARNYLREGTRLAVKLGAIPVLISAITYFGLLAYLEGDQRLALNLFGVAMSHPVYDREHEREIGIFLQQWNLDPQFVQSATDEGKRLNFYDTLQKLILYDATA